MRLDDLEIKKIEATARGVTVTLSARPVGELPEGIVKARITGLVGMEVEARDCTGKTLARVDLPRPELVDVCPLDMSARLKFFLAAAGDGVRSEAMDLLAILDAQAEQDLAATMARRMRPGDKDPRDDAPVVEYSQIWEDQLDLPFIAKPDGRITVELN